ncbi:anthranilate N-methyltransferase-like [Senna tora]|uniref:caffeate O-methyltransferase n=1 Tax=Senna tora TaxID=362788 RepID=A0A834XGZ5_9FABA|nr:anthranilate N-methyltransferase-like [Senna tora]
MAQFLEQTEAARLVVNGKEKNNFIEAPKKHQEEQEEESFSYAMQIALSTVTSFAVQTAAELGVFDIIHKAGGADGAAKLISAEEIASRLSCKNPDAPSMIDRLLCLLASHSVLRCSVVCRDDNGLNKGGFRRLYGLAPVARFFVRDANGLSSLKPFMELTQHKVSLDMWSYLKDSILEGGVAFDKFSGVPLFEYLSKDAKYSAIFNQAMINQSTIAMTKILETYKGFEGIKKLVDVGGGLGLTLKLITSKYLHIQGINFDLPHVIQQATPYPGVEHVMGDMFTSVPKGDAIFMKWILHNWSDERCVKLLKNCYESLPDEGKVIVVDAVLPIVPDTSASVKSTSQFDVLMMACIPVGGKERSEQEFMDLATSAGFSGVQFKCFVRNLWVMEFFK